MKVRFASPKPKYGREKNGGDVHLVAISARNWGAFPDTLLHCIVYISQVWSCVRRCEKYEYLCGKQRTLVDFTFCQTQLRVSTLSIVERLLLSVVNLKKQFPSGEMGIREEIINYCANVIKLLKLIAAPHRVSSRSRGFSISRIYSRVATIDSFASRNEDEAEENESFLVSIFCCMAGCTKNEKNRL